MEATLVHYLGVSALPALVLFAGRQDTPFSRMGRKALGRVGRVLRCCLETRAKCKTSWTELGQWQWR